MIDSIKIAILRKFGRELVYTKDCKILADTICQETGSRISTTTIRRLYGFLKSTTVPGKYTLNILASFIGFKDWTQYCKYKQKHPKPNVISKENWTDFHNKTLSFSKETYKMIAGQSGIPFNAVVSRKDAENRIDRFLKSSNSALSFIAPGGFGKSSMLAKWFENNWINTQSNDAILFLNASLMINFLNADFKLDTWIQEQLGLDNKNALKYYLEHSEECESKIIFVIDALDEITYDNLKLERLFIQINQFILNYKDFSRFKLIITSRNSTWGKFAMPFVMKGNELKDCWYDLYDNLEEISEANLYSFKHEEIQLVLNNTINCQYKSALKVEELAYPHKRVISNPFFLELFVKMYSPNRSYKLSEGRELIKEYIKNKIFYSRFSEEKVDILNGILDLIEHGINGTAAKKWALRELFPIHLKTAGNYYNAYQELVSYGIISEYTSTNEFNSYCKYVKITNEMLFEALITTSLIEENKGVDFELIKKVDQRYQGYELKNRLISSLISSELFNKKYLSLDNLLLLSEDTLSDPYVLETILKSAIDTEQFKSDFIGEKALNKQADKLFSKAFEDKLSLNVNDKYLLNIVVEKATSKSLKIKSIGLLLISAIFSLDKKNAEKCFQELLKEEADTSCSGSAIAIRLASIAMYRYFIDNDNSCVELLRLFYYREMAFVNYDENISGTDGEFELIMCMALIYIKSYHKVIQLIDDAEHLYYKDGRKVNSNNYKLLQCYKLFAQKALGVQMDQSKIDYLLSNKQIVKSSNNYYLQIYYYSFLSSCSIEGCGNLNVEEYFNKAIEISEYANYHLCTTVLNRKMANYYNTINQKVKEEICFSEERRILKNHSSDYTLDALLV
nr:hypothetical protein [uncultured Marinifilum sp.]